MYDTKLVSHEERCNGMITIMKHNENKGKSCQSTREPQPKHRGRYCKVTDQIKRIGEKPVGKYAIDYRINGVPYRRTEFLQQVSISMAYLSYVSLTYISCNIDGVPCSFKYIPMRVALYKLTMNDGTVYDRVTAEWVAKKFNICKQYIYSIVASGKNIVRGNKIEKVEE